MSAFVDQAMSMALASPLVMPGVAGLAAGIALGLLHFGTLRWNATLFADGNALLALAAQIGRFAVLALCLAALAKAGAVALLAGTLGLMLARHVILRHAVRTA